MEYLTKAETIKELQKIQAHHESKQETTKASNIGMLVDLVTNSSIKNYYTTKSLSGYINIGFICEILMLNYLHIEKEDNMHEIKSLVNNTPHVLTNEHVKIVYILVINQKSHGIYQVNASEILGLRLTYKNIQALKTLKKIGGLEVL